MAIQYSAVSLIEFIAILDQFRHPVVLFRNSGVCQIVGVSDDGLLTVNCSLDPNPAITTTLVAAFPHAIEVGNSPAVL
jgi:hypothetical protein